MAWNGLQWERRACGRLRFLFIKLSYPEVHIATLVIMWSPGVVK